MINAAVTSGMQRGFQLCWRLGIAGVQVLDYRMAKSGQPRLLVNQDPRGPLQIQFGEPDIQETEKGIIGIRHAGCELVWLLAADLQND